MRARQAGFAPPRQSVLAAALARAEEWLLHPEPVEREPPPPPRPERHPVVAVVGLGRKPGASTVARGLAAALAGGSRARAAALAELSRRRADRLAGPGTLAAVRLARALRPALGEPVRCCGRLCVVAPADGAALTAATRALAPLVIDVGAEVSPRGVARLADALVLVASPRSQPALAQLSAHSLERLGSQPLVVLNGLEAPEAPAGWHSLAHAVLPHAAAGARFAAGGHEPAGALGQALRALARQIEAGLAP